MGSSELRLLLIGVGIILIIGLYTWEKKKHRRRTTRARAAAVRTRRSLFNRAKEKASRFRIEPGLGAAKGETAERREPFLDAGGNGEPAPGGADDLSAAAGSAESPGTTPTPSAPLPDVLVVTVAARVGAAFDGDAIMSAARDVGLVPGQMEIFHLHDDATGEALLSMANMVKPGNFPFSTMSDFSTAGLALFAQLPAPVAPVEAYDLLLSTGERLAALLDGRLQDERRRPLTRQAQDLMRKRLAGAVT